MTGPAAPVAGPETLAGRVRTALRALVSTPVRQFQVLAMAALAVTSWMFIAIRAFRSQLPRGGIDGTLADLTAGEDGERWFSFYVALLAWGHIPVLFLILLAGAVLAVHSLVHAWREPLDAVGLVPEDADLHPDRYVPPGFLFTGAVVIGLLTFNASGLVSLTSLALFWEDEYSVAQWAALGWWALALLTAVGAVVRALRRRRIRRRWEGTPEATRAVRARRAAMEEQLSGRQTSFVQLAGAQRAGRGELFNDAERERVGAGASGWTVITLFCGLLGLGPVGLITGAAAMRGDRRSGWVGTIGISLSAVQTVVIVAALVLTIATV